MSSLLHPPVTAADALAMLRAGNRRFVRNVRSIDASHSRRAALAHGQSPNAIVLSCADSRVPSELVFDCGLGELFVVRVAGNVCAPSLVGSIEYAASSFGTQLVVVMGHSGCGAVKATLDALTHDHRHPSDNIHDIVERISPAVSPLLGKGAKPECLMHAAVRANVRHSAEQLRLGSPILRKRIEAGTLLVVAAEYSLETGEVSFFDVPAELTASAA